MTVGDNVAYGLMVRKVAKAERAARVADALRMVRLEGFEAPQAVPALGRPAPARRPGTCARQSAARAAPGRAARRARPEAPRGDADRAQAIQQQVGITFIYVTHDQEEALTMSDRLAVFNHGQIEQVGAPADVYERPATAFVAGFVGTSNLLGGDAPRAILGEDGTFTVRPEKIRLADPDGDRRRRRGQRTGTIREVVYIGPDTRYVVALDAGAELVVTQQNLTTSSKRGAGAAGKASASSGSVGIACPSRTAAGLEEDRRCAREDPELRDGGDRRRACRSAVARLRGAPHRCQCRGHAARPRAPSAASTRVAVANEAALNILAWPGYVEDGTAATSGLRLGDPVRDGDAAARSRRRRFGSAEDGPVQCRPAQYDVISASGDANSPGRRRLRRAG